MAPHPYSNGDKYQVFVDIQVLSDSLIAHFNVIASELHTSDKFSREGWCNNKLWDFDVVELFLSRDSKTKHYLELQVSPLGQKLALLIKKPRVEVEDYKPAAIEASAIITERGFEAKFQIKASDIPGDDGLIKGNAHACLGPETARSYYSLHKGDSGAPDFHKPEFFRTLGTL